MKLENRFTVPVPVEEAWKVLLDVERIAPCMPGATLTKLEGDHFEGTVKVKVGPINLTYGGKASFVSKDDAAHVAVIDGSGKETRGTGTAKALITCRLIAKGDTTEVEVDTDLNVTGKPAQFGRGVLADVSGKLVDQFAACLSEEISAGSADQQAAAQPAGSGAGSSGGTGGGTGGAAAAGAGAAVGAGAAAGTSAPPSSGASEPVFASVAQDLGAPQGVQPPRTQAGSAPTSPRPPRKPAEAIDLLDAAGAPVLKRLAPALAALLVLVLLVRRLRR